MVLSLLPVSHRDDRTSCWRVPKPATSLLLVFIVFIFFLNIFLQLSLAP